MYCDYKDCLNKKSSGVPRFRLPQNEGLAKIWLVNSGNSYSEKLINNEPIFICADHFNKSEICLNSIRSRLNMDAVPYNCKTANLMAIQQNKKVYNGNVT